ncbi:MAG: carboxypeptidase regulatory-like domain-containing protein [Planctomycetes bacterium]|nr:carboxypeptidase regulatory-like domain-containing protein [Planctomycetota bacterium]
MKRFLPLLVILAAVIGGALFVFSDSPQPLNVPDKIATHDRQQVEAAGQLNSTTTRVSEVDEGWMDYRGLKTGAGNYGLNGIVVDENDAPLADMWVAAYSAPYPFMDFEFNISEILENPLSLDLEPLAAVMSNDKGEFDLQGVPGRVIYIVARGHKHLTSGRQEVRTSSLTAEEPVVIKAMTGAEMSGRIIDSSGSPAAGAEVIVTPNLMYAMQAVRTGNIFFERTFADSSGNFKLDAVPAGTRLSVLALGGPTEPGIKDIGPYSKNASVFENVKLLDTGKLSGVVVDEEGNSVAGADVLAIPIDLRVLPAVARNIPGWFTSTNASGEYSFPDLPQRGYVLFAQSIDGRAAPISATLSGDHADIATDLVIKSKEKIKGRLVDDKGNAIANARIILNSIPSLDGGDSNSDIPSASDMLISMAQEVLPELLPKDIFVNTGSDGRFELSAWQGASVFVIAAGYPNATFELPDLKKEKDQSSYLLTMMMPGSIKGKVVDTKTNTPVEFFLANADLKSHVLAVSGNDVDVERTEGMSWSEYSQLQEEAKSRLVDERFGSILKEGEVPVTPKQAALDKLRANSMTGKADGTFSINNLMPGKWQVKVISNGYITGSQVVEVESNKVNKIGFGLSHGSTLSGRVVAFGSLNPIQGAIVSMGHNKANGFDAILKNSLSGANVTASDKDGNFTLSGIEPGMEWLSVTAEGFSDTAIKGKPLGIDEVREGVTIKVRQGATIKGFVYDRHNQILAQRMVGGFSTDSEDFWQTTTDENGFYEAKNIKPGNYFVVSAALNADSLMRGDVLAVLNGGRVLSVYAKEGETVDLDIVDLSAGGCNLKGKLTDKGAPVANAALFCMAGGASMFDLRMASAKTDENGEFEFASLAPGEYTLQVSSEAFDGTLPFEAPDAPEDYLVLETPQGVVRGQVVSESTGQPIEGVSVRLEKEDGPSGMMGMMFSRGSMGEDTDANGYYTITGVSPGKYHVNAERSWWSRNNDQDGQGSVGNKRSKSFELSMHGTANIETLALPIASALHLTVTSHDGKNIERGFQVRAVNASGEEFDSWGWSGEAKVEGLTPGVYTVTVSPRKKYAQKIIENVMVGAEATIELNVVLDTGAKLSARVLDANNQNVTASLKVLDSSGKRVDNDSGMRMFSSLENGTTELGSFADGTYTIEAEFEGRTLTQSVSLSSGDNQTVEFVF